MRVKNRSGKRDLKYKRERDNAFLRGRDAGIVRYSMAGCRVTISCTRETLSQGRLLISQGTSAIFSEMRDDGDEYQFSSSAEEEEFQEDESQTLSTLLGRVSTFGQAVRFNHRQSGIEIPQTQKTT